METLGKEFVINEYITLRLEGENTIIYVNGEKFLICKYLLITILEKQLEYFQDITSIDEASDRLDPSLEPYIGIEGELHRKEEIPAKTEFWGHCSNIQAWAEYEYDTRLLHSNLAFPLLRKLSEIGDPTARAKFREEIYKRFESFYPTTIRYLLQGKYLDFLTDAEKETLLKTWIEKDIESVWVFLIGNNYLPQFGEKYRSKIIDSFKAKLEKEEKEFQNSSLKRLFKELGILDKREFLVELFSEDRKILQEIFDRRQYPIPNGSSSLIDYTHLEVLRGVYHLLDKMSQEENMLKEVIQDQVRTLFETVSLANMLALLRYFYFEFLPVDMFKKMIRDENSKFLENLFGYMGHETIMRYLDSSLAPCEFLYKYLDEEAREILADKINELPSDKKMRIINGIKKPIKNPNYRTEVYKFLLRLDVQLF